MSGSIVIQGPPEMAERWEQHLRTSRRNAHTPLKTSRSREEKVRTMILKKESKNRIMRTLHLGAATLDRIKREMQQEGVI